LLDTTSHSPQNPSNFSVSFPVQGTGAEKFARRSRGGEKTCSICRDGPFNALIRSARLAATGCGQPIPEENSAATVIRRFTMCRRRSARACGCVLARWAVTVHRAVRPDARGSRLVRSTGLARPDPIGTSRPRKFKVRIFRNHDGRQANPWADFAASGINPSLESPAPAQEKGGRAASGVAGRSGLGSNHGEWTPIARPDAERRNHRMRLQCCRSYRDRSGEPITLKKSTTASTRMQTAVITGIRGRSYMLQP